ncbi:MAG: ATP-binding protein [Candidatus Krumholzibacteriia bacterium]
MATPNRPDPITTAADGARPALPRYGWMYRRLILLTLTCAVLPLALVGAALSERHAGEVREQVVDSIRGELDHHHRVIQTFLDDRIARLRLVADTSDLAEMSDAEMLGRVFASLNHDRRAIADLGVIDEQGRHLAYVGPHDLLACNYAGEEWFVEVVRDGVYVSDMFLGFRQEPHFIIAVAREEGERLWILRATVDTGHFRSLVDGVWFGSTGEVCLVNRVGVLQSAPRSGGRIMEPAPWPVPAAPGPEVIFVDGTRSGSPAADGGRDVVAGYVWLERPRWALVVRQRADEALAEVTRARRNTLVLVGLATVLALAGGLALTDRLVRLIRRRDRVASDLDRQLVQAGRLASLGELAAGVAHEINNPLGIILTERELLADALAGAEPVDPRLRRQLESSLAQVRIQVDRCRRITHDLLRCARRAASAAETVDLNRFAGEIVELFAPEATSVGAELRCDLEPGIPPLSADPALLQQLVLNLVNNALDAVAGHPERTVTIRTRHDPTAGEVLLAVEDTGAGIPEQLRQRIFDPFFTTKPVGQGTGLGLSICDRIVRDLGGGIAVRERPGGGARFELRFPSSPAADPVLAGGADQTGRPAGGLHR